jgi:PIN domain nuclease of toxin-antitoxin system
MTFLLDTNILLWFLCDDERLKSVHKTSIEDPKNEILVSIISLWEIVVKIAIGKLDIGIDFKSFYDIITVDYSFKIVPVTADHLSRYLDLPLIHCDPFDRLIYVQAKAEALIFLYTDPVFDLYESDQSR